MSKEETEALINDIKNGFKYPPGLVDGSSYMILQRKLARLLLTKDEELDSIFHLVEAHGAGMRQIGIFQYKKAEASKAGLLEERLDPELLAFDGEYIAGEGVLKRLKELPSEWTILQLTRQFDPKEMFSIRPAEHSPKLEFFHITRLPCGDVLESGGLPVTEMCYWPDTAEKDLLELFWSGKKLLGTKTLSTSQIRKMRNKVSSDFESYVREMGSMAFKEWLVLLLGRLCDTSLEEEIASRVKSALGSLGDSLTKRQRYMCKLLSEGCVHLEENHLERAAMKVVGKELGPLFAKNLLALRKDYPTLITAARHPVLLIVDEHMDIVPWESMPILRRHPVSRVISLHFAHALYKLHKPYIRRGLREVLENEVCYYLINPDGDLPSMEERLSKFLKKRLPHWEGLVGKKPTEAQLIDALTKNDTFVYCGHGSGCQYVYTEAILGLKVRPVQMLYGCSSAGLKDHGGLVEMTGDILQYSVAGSVCTLGMLWSVMSNDTDKMTMVLANTWLPGTPVDISTLEELSEDKKWKQEPELLRAMKEVRDCVDMFSNGAALVARGIPITLVPKK